MVRERCARCLCDIRPGQNTRPIPLDEHGSRVLPPDAASFRAEKMAALPELARSAIGERLPHNCYSIVDAEIAARAASMRGCVQ